MVVDLAPDLGYSQQVAQGLSRFRLKYPNWIFLRCAAKFLDKLEGYNLVGAVGHYYFEPQFELLHTSTVPYCVTVSGRHRSPPCYQIIPDNDAVGRMAAEYFLARGYHNFATVTFKFTFGEQRAEGFRRALREAGIEDVPELDPRDASTVPSQKLPLAVFASSDNMALTLINSYHADGLKIPEDIAVLGVDDDPNSGLYSAIPISSVRLPMDSIGFASGEAIEHMVQTGKQEIGTQLFPPIEVVERRSTAVLAVTDPRLRRAQAYIKENLKSISGVGEITREMKVSRRTLERLFFRQSGMSPAEFLMRRRAEYAEQLLIETDYTVEYIAELAGFEDRRRLYRSLSRLGRPSPTVIRRGGRRR